MSAENTPLTPGSKLGRYTLDARLGAGGNATVFRAMAENGDMVAIKVLHSDLLHEEDLTRFEREYNILQMVDHPRILRVYETGRTGGHHWIAMEFVDGKDVSEMAEQWHSESPPDRWERVEQVLRGLAEALDHLHGKGIVHRDLKPTNVLVTADGEPKLMDFGVIKAPDVFSTNLTLAGRLVGTVAFMAPEQITSEPVDQRADLYSLGAVLYVLLTNKRPIVADSIAGYLARQLAQSPRRPALVDATIPPRLDRICTKLLRKSPSERYSSAAELLAALDQEEDELPLCLHGREGALSQLGGMLMAVKDGASGCVGIFGPVGSGRSAVLDALEENFSSSPVKVLRVEADTEAIRSQLKASESHGPTALLVDDLDQVHASELRALMDGFYAFESPCMLFFTAAGSGPMDPSINEGVRDLTEMPNCAQVWLEALERRDVIGLLRDQGLTPTASAVVGRRLHAELEGIPGAILAQLDALIEAGWLERDHLGGFKPKERLERFRSAPLPLPHSVRKDIESRLKQLLRGDRALLEALAIVGGEATAELLQTVVEFRRGSLETLAKRSLVFVDTEGLHEVVCIGNPRIQQVVLDGLEESAKLRLHLKAAEGMLARNPRRVTSIAKEVALHFLAAAKPVRAMPLLEQAAQRAARRRESRKVLELTELALENESSLGVEQAKVLEAVLSRIRALRGRALYATDEMEAARMVLQVALDSGALEPASPLAVGASVDLAAAHVSLGDFKKAQSLLRPLLSSIEPGSPERLRAMRTSAQCLRLQQDLEASLQAWQSGLEVAQAQASREQEAACLLGIAKVYLASDRVDGARESLVEAEQHLRGSTGTDRADCLLQLARLDFNDGLYRQALARAEEAGTIAQEQNAMDLSALGLAICADCLEMVGLDRDAGRLSMEAEGLKRAQGTSISLASVETPTALSSKTTLRHAWDHHEAGRSEYGASLLFDALEQLPAGFRGLAAQMALVQAQLNPEPEIKARAKQLLQPILEGLSPELGASMKAREDVALILEG
jgi:serine/threonine protein kinase/tetratricopeptide (TPR) repeat protein